MTPPPARPRAFLALSLALAAVFPHESAGLGIPACALGMQSCGAAGCFASPLAVCRGGQCFPRLLGYVSSAPIACLPYINACGAGTFCSSGRVCFNGECVPPAALNDTAAASAPHAAALDGGYALDSAEAVAAAITKPIAALAAALQGLTPLQACAAARAQQRGCSTDATPLVRANGARLGYAVLSGTVECFESSAFKCCADRGANPLVPGVEAAVHGCKGSALLESAVGGLVNTTASLFGAVASGVVQATAAAAANASAEYNAAHGGAGGGGGGGAGARVPGAGQRRDRRVKGAAGAAEPHRKRHRRAGRARPAGAAVPDQRQPPLPVPDKRGAAAGRRAAGDGRCAAAACPAGARGLRVDTPPDERPRLPFLIPAICHPSLINLTINTAGTPSP